MSHPDYAEQLLERNENTVGLVNDFNNEIRRLKSAGKKPDSDVLMDLLDQAGGIFADLVSSMSQLADGIRDRT